MRKMREYKEFIRGITASVVVLVSVSSSRAKTFVYVSLAGEDCIAIYELDVPSARLTSSHRLKVVGGPGAMTTGPSRNYVFASLRSAGRLASFAIDKSNGRLSQLSDIAAGADPAFVATDRTGQYLLSAYYVAGKVTVHRILDNGKLSNEPLQTIVTDTKAHGIVTDQANRFAFVPHTGPNCIFQFRFDELSGHLSANEPLRLVAEQGLEPRHLQFHPRLPVAYTSNERASSVTVYRLDSRTGTLNSVQTLSTLPSEFNSRNSCARLEVTADGRFVYVSNRGHDSIAGFAVDSGTGRLSSLGQTDTEQTPRGFCVDPSSQFLIAAGQNSGRLALYRVQASGQLTRLDTYEAGVRPWWVMAVNVGQ